MGRSFFKWVLILCLFLIWIIILPHCGKEEKRITSALAPDFTLKTLDNQEITLSNLRGKTVLLDFWATWCGPCRQSIPHLIQIYKIYKGKGFEVIGMNMDKGDVDVIRYFVRSLEIPYPIILTPDDVTGQYRVKNLPTTFLIDKEGRIQEKIIGFNSKIANQITTKVADLVSENH